MSKIRPSTLRYEEILSLARQELNAQLTGKSPDRFATVLHHAERTQRRRSAVVSFALLAVVAIWVVSLVAHPLNNMCPTVGRNNVFELGLVPVVNMIVCVALVWSPHIGAQIFLRACCWSYLVVSTISMVGTPGLLPWSFPATALGCGTALLVLGNRGLEPERYHGVFVPIAHRTTLTGAMILAVADLQTLVAVNQANHWCHGLTNACAIGMAAAAFGLYRLRAWGLWLNLGMNIVVAALVLSGNLRGVSTLLGYMLVATAIAQVALMLPLVRSIVRGEADEHPRLL